MARQHRRQAPSPDAVEEWREWQDHQFDYDYYTRMGRVNPVLHAHFGIMLVFLGLCLSLAGLLSVLSGTVSAPALVGGVLLLAAGISVIRWASRRKRRQLARGQHTHSTAQRRRKRKRK